MLKARPFNAPVLIELSVSSGFVVIGISLSTHLLKQQSGRLITELIESLPAAEQKTVTASSSSGSRPVRRSIEGLNWK